MPTSSVPQSRPAVSAIANGTGFQIAGRARDDAEHLGDRSLVFERLLQLALASLLGLKEAHVLDGDDGLVGEDLEELDLSVGERADLGASDGDHTDGLGLARADQRDSQYGAQAKASRIVAALWILISFGRQIGDLNRSPVENSSSGENPARQGQ
jgi:hypothetical protein